MRKKIFKNCYFFQNILDFNPGHGFLVSSSTLGAEKNSCAERPGAIMVAKQTSEAFEE